MGKTPKQLDWAQAQKVSYCIPLWLRDQQIRASTARIPGRIQAVHAVRQEPIAIVCFGPSLNDTWAQIRDFPYRMTCSGAHKFLLERGLVPTWHVEVDPRPHKTILLGPPHPDVEYLIASACHAKLFDVLEGFHVKLWHVFNAAEEGLRMLPRGEWAITGGSSVGLRALTLARFLGFTNLHVFGMDGCFGASGKHAAVHPSQPAGYDLTVYDGVTYQTTQSVLECARQTWHELDAMPDVTATFYGDGLVQAMARHYVPKPIPAEKVELGFQRPALISAEYCELNRRLHHSNLGYGVAGDKHAETVERLVASCHLQSVLDYGCGKGSLARALPWPIWEYDPAMPGKDESPRPADLVVCADVLEHVEPDKLMYVLDDLRRCTRKVGYFVITIGPSVKTLADGRNTHLIQESKDWWVAQLASYFEIGQATQVGQELFLVVGPLAAARRVA